MFYLASNQAAYRRLQDELDDAFPEGEQSFSYNKAKYLPYLDAVITETLRLKPAIPSGQPRVTPPEGVQVDEVWIPGDTVGIVPPWIIQRDERNFVRALEFLPERWLPEHKEQLIKDPRAYFPFQLGKYPPSIHILLFLSSPSNLSPFSDIRPSLPRSLRLCREEPGQSTDEKRGSPPCSEFRHLPRTGRGWCGI